MILCIFMLGASLGSFVCCYGERYIKGASVIKGRSVCPNCHHTLSVFDLVPVFSWLFLKGRCRYCRDWIALDSFVCELFLGVISIVCFYRSTPIMYIRNLLMISTMLAACYVDYKIYEIPDSCQLILIVLWVITARYLPLYVIQENILSCFISVLVLAVLTYIVSTVLGRLAFGGGDIKLIGISMLYLGFIQGITMLLVASLLGICVFFTGRYKEYIPFGPCIMISTVLFLL